MREREWKLAAIAASAITIAVMLVWAGLANRRPASPIPAGVLSNDVQQQVPFGPVTLPAKAVVPAATPSRTQKSVSKPSPLHPAQAKPKGRSRRLQPDDDEVIVRRFGSQRASTQAPARDGVKRYSDLE